MDSMMIETALTQSIWAALSIGLIFYILKDQETRDKKQEARELKYQSVIQSLKDRLTILNEIQESINNINNNIANKEK